MDKKFEKQEVNLLSDKKINLRKSEKSFTKRKPVFKKFSQVDSVNKENCQDFHNNKND